MSEEREELPKIDFKDLELFKGSIKIKLDCVKPIKSGEGKYGPWHMWFGFVENQSVYYGKGYDTTKKEGYTGKVIFFSPSDIFNTKLVEFANGKVGTEVEIKKVARENKAGKLVKYYDLEKISEGTSMPQSSLTKGETDLIQDVESLVKDGYKLTKEDFITASKDSRYGNISEERANQLYGLFNR